MFYDISAQKNPQKLDEYKTFGPIAAFVKNEPIVFAVNNGLKFSKCYYMPKKAKTIVYTQKNLG